MCKCIFLPLNSLSDATQDPVSFVITGVSLGLALNPEFRVLLVHVIKKMGTLMWWLDLPGWLWTELVYSMRRLRDNNKRGAEARMRESVARYMNERDISELEHGRGAL